MSSTSLFFSGIAHYVVKDYILPWSSPPWKMGGEFYRALGEVEFSTTYGGWGMGGVGGGLSQIGGLNIFRLLVGQQDFLYWGYGDSPSPIGQKSTHPSPTSRNTP